MLWGTKNDSASRRTCEGEGGLGGGITGHGAIACGQQVAALHERGRGSAEAGGQQGRLLMMSMLHWQSPMLAGLPGRPFGNRQL